MQSFDQFKRGFRRSNMPATLGLIGTLSVLYVLAFLGMGQGIAQVLGFENPAKVWTFLTYPFASSQGEFVFEILFLFWLWSVGGIMERIMGSARMLIFWAIATVAGAIFVLLGGLLSREPSVLMGSVIPVACLTVAWATLEPNAQVQLMFILPIMVKWLGWIMVGVVLFDVGQGRPLVGAFALIPLAITYLVAANRIPGLSIAKTAAKKYQPSKQEKQKQERYFDDVNKREKERQEKEELRKLFERSMTDDKDR